MSILIKNIQLYEKKVDIYIEDNKFKTIGRNLSIQAEKVINGTNLAACPSFFNAHTHAAMTLMRSYSDDMKLMDWLQNAIWPLEAKLTTIDVYWGTKLAVLEMIKSGTTIFADMYYYFDEIAKVSEEMGLRSLVSTTVFDHFDKDLAEQVKASVLKDYEISLKYPHTIFTPAPHSIYTVSTDTLRWVADFSKSNDMITHIHLSETETEVQECLKNHGVTPVKYLAKIGFLTNKTIAAHCLHLTDDDINILADYDVKIAHNPISNMKLASGKVFRYEDMKKAGLTIAIGTDGTASNNNLDMLESAKFASLHQKVQSGDPTVMPADEVFKMLTETAEVFTGLKIGKIEEGYLADMCLVKLNTPEMMPNHNYISNLIYSANGNAVDTVICNGKIVMEDRNVPSEQEVYDNLPKIVESLINR